MKWKSLSHVRLCDPIDCIVHRILQARILEWVTFPFSRGSSQPRDQTPGLLHCRRNLYQLSHQETYRKLLWVTYYNILFHVSSHWFLTVALLGTIVSHLPEVSTSVDLTYLKSEVFRKKKVPDSSKEQNLNLLTMGNYLESTLHHVYTCIRYCK